VCVVKRRLTAGKRKQEEKKKTESRKGENEVDEHNDHFFGYSVIREGV